MTKLSVVGKSECRIDSLEKVTGTASYFSDIRLPGMLHIKALRSPYPHAEILNIDTSEAEKAPGVKCIVTNKDTPQKRWGRAWIQDRTILARDKVRHVGESVAAVAAETIEAAEYAVALIKVNYKKLPALLDIEEAMSKTPITIVHPELTEYTKTVSANRLVPDRPNAFTHIKIRKGDVEKGFQEADLVLENRFTTTPIQHAPLETHGVVVRPELDGGLTFWAGRQSIWELKSIAAEVFDIKSSKIRIIQQYLGGGFGGKLRSIELIPALLALKTRRSVKWAFTREEEFLEGAHRLAMNIYIKDGIKEDGTLMARQIQANIGMGAYGEATGTIIRNCFFGAVGDYRIPNFNWDAFGVYTNEPPGGSFRGLGSTQIIWAVESHMDMLAEKLKIDPVEIRRKNILREGEPNIQGEIVHSIGTEECLNRMNEFIQLNKKSPAEGTWKRGKGIAIGNKYSLAPTTSVARIKVTEEGDITIYHSADELGQGVNTVMAQVAAEEFGIPFDDVKVLFSDTSYCPYIAGGSTSSRITYNLGNAVRLACREAKRGLFTRSAEMLGASPDELDIKNKTIFVKDNPEKNIRLSELFFSKSTGAYGGVTAGRELLTEATYIQDFVPEDPDTGQIDPEQAAQGKRLCAFYSHTAKAVEIAVDEETGQVKVIRIGSATDLGKAINPKLCEQQAEGGVGMGIGSALFEEMIMKNGNVANPNFIDYRLPATTSMPLMENVKSLFVESAPHKDGPFGAKGFAEGAMIGTEPAIANAVYNAIGIRIKDLPITPEKVLKALKEKEINKTQHQENHQ